MQYSSEELMRMIFEEQYTKVSNSISNQLKYCQFKTLT